MIKQKENLFLLSTNNTSLLLRVDEGGKPCTEYFGRRIDEDDDHQTLISRYPLTQGRAIFYPQGERNGCLNDIASEYSTPLRGDFNNPSLVLRSRESAVFDFVFTHSEIRPFEKMKGYPTPHDANEELVLYCEDKAMKTVLELHYVVFEKANVFGRFIVIRNESDIEMFVNKAMSMQLVLDDAPYELETFYGNWAAEFNREVVPIQHLRYSFDSATGSSSDFRNPFFIIQKRGTTYKAGEAYGFNLIYSGNHLEEIEKSSFGKVRIEMGISSLFLNIRLLLNDEFVSPMAVMSYTDEGLNGVAHNMHCFVNTNIVPKHWSDRPRPIAYNNWEATYFKFNEQKVHALAKKAKDFGVELFVLDDGWFAERNDDKHSLGDWYVNTKKLRHGINGLSEYVHHLGMKFGLWFEPEAVSPESDLAKEHPDWIIRDGIHEPLMARNQYMLDLTIPEVRAFILDFLFKTIEEAKIDYIKWDYNRPMSDIPYGKGFFFHQYILGLYEIFDKLTERFPELQIENCASGGARNDLGMFSYCCQGWVSDDTDSFQRAHIQSHMLLGYPPSVMSNHVAAKTNHQLLRRTSFGTKFDVACIGVLGFELDIVNLDPVDEKEIQREIEFYKANREVCQFGTVDILTDFEESGFLAVEAHDENSAVVTYVNDIQLPNPPLERLALVGLDPDAFYTYEVREEKLDPKKFGGLVNMISPIHVKEEGKLVVALSRRIDMPMEKFTGKAKGSSLNSGGFKLQQQWSGVGFNDEIRVVGDFGARVYLFKKESE
ncbi:MAG: alpha-galactosidase [Bacilli bacterium]|nr:alpha-galactosidase [Bacilli bacterium]